MNKTSAFCFSISLFCIFALLVAIHRDDATGILVQSILSPLTLFFGFINLRKEYNMKG